MTEILIAVAVVFLLTALPLMWVIYLLVEEHHRKDAVIADLLDRIQAPDIDAYKMHTLEAFPAATPPGFLYDPTGLIQVEDYGDGEPVE